MVGKGLGAIASLFFGVDPGKATVGEGSFRIEVENPPEILFRIPQSMLGLGDFGEEIVGGKILLSRPQRLTAMVDGGGKLAQFCVEGSQGVMDRGITGIAVELLL